MSAITIPGRIIRFLDHQANVAFAGTRDRDLVPCGHRVSAWRLDADRGVLTALVAEGFTAHLLDALQDNGEIAVTVEEFPSHETYQFKGRYLRHRALGDEDTEAVHRIRERFKKTVRHVYPDAPEHLLALYIRAASVAIEFEVREIYTQTPGPGAGARLVPPAEG